MNGRILFGLPIALLGASLAEAKPATGFHLAMYVPARAPKLSYSLTGLLSEAVSWSRAPRHVVASKKDGDETSDLKCLTAAVYYEARSESPEGQRAVAQVVLNRVNKPAFAPSVCGVVHQRAAHEASCQFKFNCDGSIHARRDERAWATAMRIAREAMSGLSTNPIGSATFYHAVSVSPGWSQRLARVAVIGSHIFYRMKG